MASVVPAGALAKRSVVIRESVSALTGVVTATLAQAAINNAATVLMGTLLKFNVNGEHIIVFYIISVNI